MNLLKFGLLGNERFALNQCVNECGYGMIFFLRSRGNFIGQVLVGEPKGTAQTVTNQMLSKPTGKIVFFLSDQISHFEVARELRTFMKFTGWIDIISFFPMLVFGPPFTGGGKVFQPEPDRINLAVATGTLRFFLVRKNPFAGGERLLGQAGKLGNIGGCRRWWIIQKVA